MTTLYRYKWMRHALLRRAYIVLVYPGLLLFVLLRGLVKLLPELFEEIRRDW